MMKGRGGNSSAFCLFVSTYVMIKKYLKNKWFNAGLLTSAAILLTLFISLIGILHTLELKTFDLRLKVRGNIPLDDSAIAIVAIDDQSFVSLQQKWPFPRSYFAKAIENLTEAGARMIIFDIVISEPSTHNPEDDYLLAESIYDATDVIFAGKIAIEILRSRNMVNKYLIKPIKPILEAGAEWAYANVDEDPDGFIRRYKLFQFKEDQIYFPLGIKALEVLQQTENVQLNNDNHFIVGKLAIPKYSYDSMIINYYGPANNFPTYSFANILDDMEFDLPEDEDTDIFEIHKESGTFQNKIVMIGASAEELQDNKFTPFFSYEGIKTKMPGVEMHANALNTIIQNDYIFPLNAFFEFLAIVVLSILSMVFSKLLKPYQGLICGIVVIGLFTFYCFFMFIQFNIWCRYLLPLVAFVSSYGINTIHQVLTEQKEKGLYRKTFQQYVTRSVVDTMLSSGELPKFGGERRTLTVLFSDIRSFTSFSEKYPPETVVQRLKEYLSAMVDIILQHNGTLDKFVGDEIMAVYGAPYYYKNHAELACLTALDMIAELRHIQKKWSQNQMEYFQIGIGINTGKVIVGNLGSVQLFDYTVIGDEVNLGARLEGANKFYSTTIIISEFTYEQVKEKAIVRELDVVRVKGKKKPVKIYELRGMYTLPSIENELIIDVYKYGLELFKLRRWYQALKQFKKIIDYFPSDGPARIYTQRCLNYMEIPPPDDWNGVIDFSTK